MLVYLLHVHLLWRLLLLRQPYRDFQYTSFPSPFYSRFIFWVAIPLLLYADHLH
jgi:hypothetical protein